MDLPKIGQKFRCLPHINSGDWMTVTTINSTYVILEKGKARVSVPPHEWENFIKSNGFFVYNPEKSGHPLTKIFK
jgi:hypothetical protein